MLSFFQTHGRGLFLLTVVLFGFSCGRFSATLAGAFLSPGGPPAQERVVSERFEERASHEDIPLILERNIFDSAARTPAETFTGGNLSDRTIFRGDLYLCGTVSSKDSPFAMIRIGENTEIFYEGDSLPDGSTLHRITRNLVLIRQSDGSLSSLLMPGETDLSPPRTSASEVAPGVRVVGENRWIIDRMTAEGARQNIGTLIKSARIEPNVIAGRTDGFTVKMIRSGSLLAELGLRVGDVIKRINGLDLDSPEKALQIFQQLREARSLSLNLQRNGSPLNFEYEVD